MLEWSLIPSARRSLPQFSTYEALPPAGGGEHRRSVLHERLKHPQSLERVYFSARLCSQPDGADWLNKNSPKGAPHDAGRLPPPEVLPMLFMIVLFLIFAPIFVPLLVAERLTRPWRR